MHGVMNIIAMVTPRLDLMAQTSWLVYPDDPVMFGYGFMIAQGVFYTALLIVAALIDLRRRQF
jgi:membrane protein DedA with SNARE-associated domain